MTGHPLFPARDDSSDPPEVLTIHVVRAGEGYAARVFAPDELQTLEQLFELYGGGNYTLIARNDRHVTARATYPLTGPSKPLNDGATVGNPPPTPQAQMVAPVPVAAPMGEGLLTAILGMMVEGQKTTAQMFSEMATRDREAANRHIENMQALHDRHERSQAAMFKALADARQKDGGSAEWFMRGQQEGRKTAQEVARIVADRMPDGEDKDDLLGDLTQILGPILAGAQAHQQQAQQQPRAPGPGPVVAQPPPAPPPSSAPGGNGRATAGQVDFSGLRPQGQPITEPDEDELEP